MSGEEEENAAELKIPDEFLKAKCLMNCEVALILEHKYEQLQQMADDPMNQMSQVFEKSLQYVKRFSRYKNPDAVRQVREYPSVFYVQYYVVNSNFVYYLNGNTLLFAFSELYIVMPKTLEFAVLFLRAHNVTECKTLFHDILQLLCQDMEPSNKSIGVGFVSMKSHHPYHSNLRWFTTFIYSQMLLTLIVTVVTYLR
ncbi:hypothetical protein ACS0TY_023843 [Phlomoides rotata]